MHELHVRAEHATAAQSLLHDALGSYQTALWCLVALEGVAAASVLGGRGIRDDP